MNAFLAGCGTALWLGILTSISPCPLASNIAALSYMARDVTTPRRVVVSGLAYSLGRSLSYVIVGAIVVSGLLSIPGVSFFLQKRINQALGPVLILAGIGLMGWWPARLTPPGWSDSLRERVARGGTLGAVGLGMLFALSFCPVSAGIFFGGLVPLASGLRSRLLLPALYGLGTGLPVVTAAVTLASGLHHAGRLFQVLARIEKAARPASGIAFLLIGGYLTVVHWLRPA